MGANLATAIAYKCNCCGSPAPCPSSNAGCAFTSYTVIASGFTICYRRNPSTCNEPFPSGGSFVVVSAGVNTWNFLAGSSNPTGGCSGTSQPSITGTIRCENISGIGYWVVTVQIACSGQTNFAQRYIRQRTSAEPCPPLGQYTRENNLSSPSAAPCSSGGSCTQCFFAACNDQSPPTITLT